MDRGQRRGLLVPVLAAVLTIVSAAVDLSRIAFAGLGRGYENVEIAKALAAGQGFANPFRSLPTGPTAHCAPVFPLLLAAPLLIFGTTASFANAVVLLDFATQMLSMLLLPLLSRRLFGSTLPGWCAAWLMVSVMRPAPQVEVAVTTLLSILCFFAILSGREYTTGGLLGITALTSPPAFLALSLAAGIRLPARKSAGAIVIALLLCVPWIIRDRVQLGAWVPIRDNFGMELWLSNTDGAGPVLETNPILFRMHPTMNAETAAHLRAVGEVEFNREKMREAVAWIAGHPAEFIRLTASRFRQYWLPSRIRDWWLEVFPGVWVLTILGFAGLKWAPREVRWMLAPFLLVYPLPYYLLQSSIRYRAPVLWVSALLAGCALAEMVRRFRARRAGSGPYPRVSVSGV